MAGINRPLRALLSFFLFSAPFIRFPAGGRQVFHCSGQHFGIIRWTVSRLLHIGRIAQRPGQTSTRRVLSHKESKI